jgi:hypothetical protein
MLLEAKQAAADAAATTQTAFRHVDGREAK